MKLFQHSSGIIIAFGFDMSKRLATPNMISWSDRDGKRWEGAADNEAGRITYTFEINPEFVLESNAKIFAYQPGRMLQMTYNGAPWVWQFEWMTPALVWPQA